MAQPSLHPVLDGGLPSTGAMGSAFPGGTLLCRCSADKVEVTVDGNVAHNHACGCSKCWKPEGALFSLVGVVPADKLKVTAHEEKLHVVDEAATIRRHACRRCGVHMYGTIEKDHPFKGLDFIHVELSDEKGWQPPQFAGFVSSIIEQGFRPEGMEGVRSRFKALSLPTYDCLSPPLMDAIATFAAKHAATPAQTGVSKRAPASEPTLMRPAPGEPAAASLSTTADSRQPVLTTTTVSPSARPPVNATVTKKKGGIAGFFSKLLGG